jgi:hypothetical protein
MTETVLIYATKHQRKQLTRQGIEILTEYEDYVLAQATADEVITLQASGYEVEVYAATPSVRGVGLGARERVSQGPPPAEFGPGPHHYVVEFGGPIKPEWLAAIEAHGGRALEPMPPFSYIVALDDAAYKWITTEASFVNWVTHYGSEMRIDPDLSDTLAEDPLLSRGSLRTVDEPEAPGVERVPTIFSVRFFEADDLVAALPAIRDLGGIPGEVAAGSTVTTVSFRPDDPDVGGKVEQLAGLHGVRAVEPYALRQLRNNVAAGLMGAKEVSSPAGLGLSGRGEVVGVADSGLDTGNAATIHPDFSGRVAAILSWPVAADWSTVVTNVGGDDGAADTRSGHGTHVAGSVCGNGSASLAVQPEPVRGLAFEGNLVFQAVEQRLQWTEAYRQAYYRQYHRYPPDSGLAGLPVDLKVLFQQAYDAGARVHNNSWGGGDFGAYDDYAEAVDRFMWEHKDFLILFAAGNDGSDGNRNGVVDEGSLTPPGTAKNVITVGAAESMRADGGYQRPYGQLWPSDYPTDPLKSDKPSDNGDDLAAFSSRGPTRDGRIKPDLVAPGTNILSVRSQALPAGANPGWGAWTKAPGKYMFDGGTSMATPLTTGAAAVVRQYLRTVKRRANPSAALVKATLLHGAQYRSYRHAPPAGSTLYDFAQGWGHLDLQGVLAPAAPVQVKWYDNRKGLNTGQSWRWSATVAHTSVSLAITLAWTDYPGAPGNYPNLVNDLDLVVTAPSGAIYYGNDAPGQAGGKPDRVNNVERVVIPAPEAGRYTIRVRGTNVPRGPQDFALVYSGGIR